MQYLFGSTAASSSCAGAIAAMPVVTLSELAAPVDTVDFVGLVYDAAVGEKLPYGGSFYKENVCDEVSLIVSYLVKDNACDACAVDTNTADDVQAFPDPIVIPAGVPGITLPEGYIASIEATIVGGSTKGNLLKFVSSRAGLCEEVVLA